ncbi:alpha/beta hydrolase family protein [Mycobacterium stomatepiae]|nr:prolyl oligopeptidase family serine peptidase [Mycobacterium stomatepiae]MCV7166164.1 prolyl oligopeptidase family serine peptidase [Mycobacterium stomatepiae]
MDRPVMLAEGGNDELCVPGTVVRLAHDLRAKGSEVDYHFYPEAGHLAAPHHAFVDALQFVRRIAPSCQGSQPDISDLVPR